MQMDTLCLMGGIIAQILEFVRVCLQIEELCPVALIGYVFPASLAHHESPVLVDRPLQRVAHVGIEGVVEFTEDRVAPVIRVLAAQQRYERTALDDIVGNLENRDEFYLGGNYGENTFFDDGLSAISVPIRVDDKVLGCVNLVWMRQAVPVEDFVVNYLADLRAAADEIIAAYNES
jgi:hypothetical protein